MQVNATVGLLYAQTGFATRVASDATTAPEAALAMSRTIASEMAKLEQQQVQAPEATVEARIADDGELKQKSQDGSHSGERSKQEKEQEEASVSPDPLVGNLLNIKV